MYMHVCVLLLCHTMSDVQVGTLASCYTVELLKIKELSSFQGLYCTMYNMLYLKNVELI